MCLEGPRAASSSCMEAEPIGKRGARRDFGRGVAGRNFGRGVAGNGELSPATEKSSADEAERKLWCSEAEERLAPKDRSMAPRDCEDRFRPGDPAKVAVLKQPGGDWS